MHQHAFTLSVRHKIRQIILRQVWKIVGKIKHDSVRNREESHETDPTPPPTVFKSIPRSLLLCKQICSLALMSFTLLSREQFTRPFISKRGHINLKTKTWLCLCIYNAQSRLRRVKSCIAFINCIQYVHVLLFKPVLKIFLHRKLFCSLNLSVIREETKSEKENKWRGRRFGIVLRLGINFNESWVELSFCEGLFEKVSLNSKSHAMLSENHTWKTFV